RPARGVVWSPTPRVRSAAPCVRWIIDPVSSWPPNEPAALPPPNTLELPSPPPAAPFTAPPTAPPSTWACAAEQDRTATTAPALKVLPIVIVIHPVMTAANLRPLRGIRAGWADSSNDVI